MKILPFCVHNKQLYPYEIIIKWSQTGLGRTQEVRLLGKTFGMEHKHTRVNDIMLERGSCIDFCKVCFFKSN